MLTDVFVLILYCVTSCIFNPDGNDIPLSFHISKEACNRAGKIWLEQLNYSHSYNCKRIYLIENK